MEKQYFNEHESKSLLDSFQARLEKEDVAIKVNADLLYSFGLTDLTDCQNMSDEDFTKAKFNLTSEDYPDYFGGTYIANDGGLVVCTTGDVDKVRKTVGNIVNTDDFTVVKTLYSYKELLAAKEAIEKLHDANKDDTIFKNITAYGANAMRNDVFIEMKDLSHEQVDLFKKQVSDFPALIFRQGYEGELDSEAVETSPEINSVESASFTVRPGELFQAPGFSPGTVGYRAVTGGVEGFITTGHGPRMGARITVRDGLQAREVGVIIGHMLGGNVDAAFVRTDTGIGVTNVIFRDGVPHSGTIRPPALQMTVWSSGTASGLRSGTVLELGYTHTYGVITIRDVARANYSRAPRDSGGPVFYRASNNSRDITGIHRGSTAAGHAVFVLASNILAAFRAVPF